MTTIATGGFSNYNQSIGYFNSAGIEFASIIFILLGSIPFIAYVKFINGNRKIFLNDSQIKTFIKLILISISILFLYLFIKNGKLIFLDFRSIIFNIVSILTGTGYVSGEYDKWGSFPLFYFEKIILILQIF